MKVKAIPVNSSFCAVRVSGCATDPVGLSAIPLPFTSGESPVRSVGISADSTNIIIKVSPASDFTAYTHAFVVLEYIKKTKFIILNEMKNLYF